MTKDFDNNDEKKPAPAPNMPAHSTSSQNLPQSPQEQILEFINTLGEHVMDEVMSNVSSHTEKGESSTSGQKSGGNAPPDYDFTDKNHKGETATFAHRGDADEPAGPSSASNAGSVSGSATGERNNRNSQNNQQSQNQSQNQGGNWGPWGGNWRDCSQNPWHAMASMFGGAAGPEGFTGDQGPSFAHGVPPCPPGGPGMGFGFGGPAFGFGGPPHRGRGGHCGPPGGRGGHYGGPWGWKSRRHWGNRGGADDQDFCPPLDLFDTPESFVIHVALPGAIKEDIGINYDFEKSELQVSGVVHRPGNEEFLGHLVDGERRVGAFDRKIKLESKGKTVAVDADAITAKLENGLLEITVPKLRKADEPEKRKIRIE